MRSDGMGWDGMRREDGDGDGELLQTRDKRARRLKEQIGGFGQQQPGWIVGCYLFLGYYYAVDCRGWICYCTTGEELKLYNPYPRDKGDWLG